MRRILFPILALFALPLTAQAGGPPFTATPVPYYLTSGVRPGTMFRSAIAKIEQGQAVNACIAGDSTATGNPNGVHLQDGVWPMLQTQLVQQNPGVSFNFEQFAVGGTAYGSLLQTNIAGPALWYQYVNQGACDLLFYDFGVNDSWSLSADTLRNVINSIGSAASRPAQVFITNGVANPSAGQPYGLPTYQAGYIAGSGLVRSLIQSGTGGYSTAFTNPIPPLGIIDVNRYFQQTVLGRDYGDQTSIQQPALAGSNVTLAPGVPYSLPATDGDFDLSVTIPNGVSLLSSGKANALFFQTGAADGVSVNQNIVYLTTGGSTIYLVNNTGAYSTFTRTINTASPDINIRISVKDSYYLMVVNGAVIQGNFLRNSGPFVPTISIGTNGSSSSISLPIVINSYALAKARAYNPILSNSAAYGPLSASVALQTAAAAGSNQLTFASLPSQAQVGGGVLDSTNSTAFPSTSIVTAINGNTVTISGVAGTNGVAAGDLIAFSPVAPSGGNGINHDASGALNYVWRTVLNNTDLHMLPWTENRSAMPSRATIVPTANGATAATQGLMHLSLNPAAAVSGYAITLPPNPYAGDTFELTDDGSAAVSGITVGAPSGASVVNQATTVGLTTGTAHLWRYNASLTAWVQRY